MVESSVRTRAGDAGYEITAEDYRRLYPQIYAQLRRLGVPPADAEDLIQETFLHAQEALDRGQFQGRSNLDTWVVSIAKGRALKYHRRRRAAKRQAALLSLDEPREPESGVPAMLPSSEPDPLTYASDRQRFGRTRRGMESLPEEFRAPLVLSVRGHSYDEIATLLRIPVSLVTSRIHQARAKLRKHLSAGAGNSSG